MATIPTEITVPVSTVPSDVLMLRELWASATTDDDYKIELFRSGGALILDLTNPDGERVRQKITIEDLVFIWARRFGVRVDPESAED